MWLRSLASLAIAILLCSPSALHGQENRIGTVTETVSIFAAPDTTQQPLRVAKEGTTLRVLKTTGEWLYIEFGDPQLGIRQGYVQSRSVKLPSDATLQPMDLSVPNHSAVPPSVGPKGSDDKPKLVQEGGRGGPLKTLFMEDSENKDDQLVSACLVQKLTASGKFTFVPRQDADAIVSLRSTIPSAGKRILLGSSFGGASKVTLRLRDQTGKLIWEGDNKYKKGSTSWGAGTDQACGVANGIAKKVINAAW